MLIFLVGYMASGKTTIGRKLNQRLKSLLCDTDRVIVTSEGLSIAEIFDTKGEEYFRELESSVIKELIISENDAVISTGGGLPLWGDNMKLMNDAGLTVYLCRSAENIVSRVSERGRAKRPKLRGLSDEELLNTIRVGVAERNDCYQQAQLVIDADNCSDDMIVDAIINHINYLTKR